MNKFLISAAIAAIALSSCSKETPSDVQAANGNPIDFRTNVDKTRTTATIGNNLTNFTVNAIKSGSATFDFMSQTPVVKDLALSSWSYAPPKYWPSPALDVSFYAYSPAASANVNAGIIGSGTSSTLSYTVPSKSPAIAADKLPEDFLVSTYKAQSGSVKFPFFHALSSVSFSAINKNSADHTFVIEGIQITNLSQTGTLTFTAPGSGSLATISNFTWGSYVTPKVTYIASIPSAGVILEGKGTGATAVQLTSYNEGMMVLPQTTYWEDDATPAKEANVEVTYHSYDGSGTVTTPVGTKKTFVLANSARNSGFIFAKNTKYNFTFTFDATGKVSFDAPTVEPWTTGSTTIL